MWNYYAQEHIATLIFYTIYKTAQGTVFDFQILANEKISILRHLSMSNLGHIKFTITS